MYETDPTQPIGNIKEAWVSAKRRSRRLCPNCDTGILIDREKSETGHICADCNYEVDERRVGVMGVRFHDLRHTAVSRMIVARILLPIIAKIVGWSTVTLAKMSARYVTLQSMNSALPPKRSVRLLSREAGYPQFPPQSDAPNSKQHAN